MCAARKIEPDAETLSPVLPADIVRDAARLMVAATQAGLGIATAESCTGGLLASLLTDIEGVSSSFERGFLAYSEDAKTDMLGVSRELIERCGAVSEPVARAMAEGALRNSGAQIAMAITGFAGPGGHGDEAGLVHFACATTRTETQHEERHFGDIGRGQTRIECLRVAVDLMSRRVPELASYSATREG